MKFRSAAYAVAVSFESFVFAGIDMKFVSAVAAVP